MASLDGINDSKQSDEIQATFTDCFNCLHTERSP